jgi:hypothetical protein
MRLPRSGIIIGSMVAVVTVAVISGFLVGRTSITDTPPSSPEVAVKQAPPSRGGQVLGAQDDGSQDSRVAVPYKLPTSANYLPATPVTSPAPIFTFDIKNDLLDERQ